MYDDTQHTYMTLTMHAQTTAVTHQQDCVITDELKAVYKKLRFSRDDFSNGLIIKINTKAMTVELDEEYKDTTLEEIAEDLEEQNPRFVVFSYKWERDDGRKQFPIVMIHYSPEGSNPINNMLYSRMRVPLVNEFHIQRTYEVRDQEDLTTEWLLQMLKKA